MYKKELPILDHRYSDTVFITPELFLQYQSKIKKASIGNFFPEYCILTSQNSIVGYLRKKYGAKKYLNWTSNRSSLYTFRMGKKIVGVINLGLGSPQAVIIAELLISLGVKYFFLIGSIGGIQKDFKIGDLILATKAIRDEGTSYHYLPPSKYALASKGLSSLFGKFLLKQSLKFRPGIVWTTDALFRESIREVIKYQREGVLGVDMKASALFALAKCRKIDICALFYISDLLRDLKWKPYLYSSIAKGRQNLLSDIVSSFIRDL